MRGAGSAQDVVELVGAEGSVKVGDFILSSSNAWALDSSDKWKIQHLASVDTPYYSTTVNGKCAAMLFTSNAGSVATEGRSLYKRGGYLYVSKSGQTVKADFIASVNGIHWFYELATPLTFTSLFLSASSTADELTQMPADAIPLSEIQFADNNWSIEEAIYDAPEADANGVITPTAVTGQMRIHYSLDAAEQIDTLQKEYAALEASVAALENA